LEKLRADGTKILQWVSDTCGPGIEPRYGLESPMFETRWGRDFSDNFRQETKPTHPPLRWVSSLSRDYCGRRLAVEHNFKCI